MTGNEIILRSKVKHAILSGQMYPRGRDLKQKQDAVCLLFLFACSMVPPTQVLLVLDGVDAMFEGQGGDARDALVGLLSDLCRFNGRLHLLMTSEQSVLRGTTNRIQNGSERVS